MAEDFFRFRCFNINQQGSPHRVGTDAMLLGAFTEPGDAQNILDIGTGTGVLALMMAQNSDAIIDAVESDPAAANRAAENFAASPWAQRINLYPEALQKYNNKGIIHYDLIICNPPYFVPNPSTPEYRAHARQTNSLTFDELAENAGELLAAHGRLAVILPLPEAEKFVDITLKYGFHLLKSIWVSSYNDSAPVRRIMEFGRQQGEVNETNFYIYESKDVWSDGYKKLTEEFHWKKEH